MCIQFLRFNREIFDFDFLTPHLMSKKRQKVNGFLKKSCKKRKNSPFWPEKGYKNSDIWIFINPNIAIEFSIYFFITKEFEIYI